ncbi:MAG: hypothetical protein AABY04_02020 [Candidatus Micrarchaeota archaeon]
MAYSTISVSPGIKKRLESQKIYHRETYDDLLGRLLDNAKWADDEGEFTEQTKEDIKKGLAEIKAGKTVSLDYVLAKNNIKRR